MNEVGLTPDAFVSKEKEDKIISAVKNDNIPKDIDKMI